MIDRGMVSMPSEGFDRQRSAEKMSESQQGKALRSEPIIPSTDRSPETEVEKGEIGKQHATAAACCGTPLRTTPIRASSQKIRSVSPKAPSIPMRMAALDESVASFAC